MAKIAKLSAKVLVATALVGNVAMAGAFVGVEGGGIATWVNADNSVLNPETKSFVLGLKGGYDFGKYRVWGGYNYKANAEDTWKLVGRDNGTGQQSYVVSAFNWKAHDVIVGAEFTPSLTRNFQVLLGGYTGISFTSGDLKLDTVSVNYGEIHKAGSKTGTGIVLGGKVGGIYAFNANHEIEFGIKAEYQTSGVSQFDSATSQGGYIGYNYKF